MALADLTTLAAVKTFSGTTGFATDDVLSLLITACSAFVRSWLNRDITVNSYDIRRSGRNTPALQLPQYPIQSIELIEIDGRAIPEQPSWGAQGFYFDEEQIALCGHRFRRGVSNVHIQYTAGYPDIPADIAQAVNKLVTLEFRMRDKLEWSSKSLAGETVSLMQKDMPSSVATTLRQYQRIAPL